MGEPRGRPEAIVRPWDGERAFTVERLAPRKSLAEFVDYHWLVRWDVRGEHRQQVVPQPRVHVVAEKGRLLVHGLSREPFFRTLSGRGHVLGAAFRPGGFRPLLQDSVAALTGTVQPAAGVFGLDDEPVAAAILSPDHAEETGVLVGLFEDYLERTDPRPDPVAVEVTAIVAEAERRRELTRAEELAAVAGMSLRSLQRLFTEYVGIGPKWVIQRFRILEVAAAATGEERTDWAALAQELGFTDQAHLVRAFTQVVGTPPAAYQRERT
jgi:AraC-like DNA-binding protein